MRSTVHVRGIETEGRHGANPGERDQPQPFVVDVEVVVDAQADSMWATLDYAAIADTVRDLVGGTSFELLETLAFETARAIYGLAHVERATVVVHKPAAADIVGAADVAAEATIA
jgi:dihydroneopterin aldolase